MDAMNTATKTDDKPQWQNEDVELAPVLPGIADAESPLLLPYDVPEEIKEKLLARES